MAALKQISKQSLSDKVYEDLRTALMDGQFEPGERIKIGALAEDLGLSMTPVREAIFRLVSEKALVMKAATSVHVPQMDVEDLKQIRLIRLALEGDAAAKVARDCPAVLLAQLRAIQDEFITVIGTDPKRASLLNRRFHFALAEASRWDIVMHTISSMWAMIGPVLNEFHRAIPQRELSGEHRHELVLRALRERDPEAARRAICHDIEWGDHLIEWVAQKQAAE